MEGTPQMGPPKFQLFNRLCLAYEIFRICKYEEKIKFDEIWGYQNEGILFKQGRQNSKFNPFCWTDEIFRINKMKIKFDKIWGFRNEGIPSNKDAKIQN